MINVRTCEGGIELTCEGPPWELVADICCIVKEIGEDVPEQYREMFYGSLLETLDFYRHLRSLVQKKSTGIERGKDERKRIC